MTNCHQLWEVVLEDIHKSTSSTVFKSFFSTIEPISFEEDVFTLKVNTIFIAEWLKQQHEEDIVKKLSEIFNRPILLKINIDENAVFKDIPEEEKIIEEPKKIIKNKKKQIDFTLKSDFDFDNFIIGDSNQMAHAAAFATGQNPGYVYNPLFIYGGVGLGKTHLMQAIGHSVYQRDNTQNVLYVSCEKLFNEYIDAIQKKTTSQFRDYYRSNVDVLLIDDIQFLSKKEGLQEEFFHTFNAFLQDGKQIVMTSDKSPQELQHIENRLVNRFEWGLVVDIQAPNFETRVAIIQKKLEKYGILFDEEINFYLANMVRSDVRKIEGALTKLIAYSSVQNTPVTLKFAQECLKDYVVSQTVTLDNIQQTVAQFYDIAMSDIKSHRRPRKIAQPRQFAMYLCRSLTNNSLTDIAQSFGGKDHTTVMYACRKVKQLITEDMQVKLQLEKLEKSILSCSQRGE